MKAHFKQISFKKKNEETALIIQVQPRTIEFDANQKILIIKNSKENTEIRISVMLKDQIGNYHSYLLNDEFLISVSEDGLSVREL